MSTTRSTAIIWQAHLRSLRNASRHDTRMQVAFVVVFVFNVLIGFWSANQLLMRLHQWHMQGPLAVDAGLWSLCWLTWSGMSFFALLGSIRQAFSDDEAMLLFPLPIAPATRFRALFGLFFIENLWNWLLLEVGVTGYVLVTALGWHALAWLIVLQLGVGVVALFTLIVTLLAIRYLLPSGQVKVRLIAAVVLGLMIMLAIRLSLTGSIAMRTAVLWLRPEIIAGVFVLLLVLVLGPLANTAGQLYIAAFQVAQSWDRSRKATTLPGIRTLTRLLARRRTLMGAFFVKMLLSQSRNVIAWGRIAIVLIVLLLFPQLYGFATHLGWSNTLFVIVYAAGVAIFTVIEQAPNAISGEANRLTIYLTTPLKLAQVLWAKFILFLLPVLFIGLSIGLFLSWWLVLPPSQATFAIVAIVLLIFGPLILFVWGSAWDEDINLAVEGMVQTIMQEEVPLTPRRIWLLNLGTIFFVLLFLFLWKLPPVLALTAIALLDVGALLGMQWFSKASLQRLLREG